MEVQLSHYDAGTGPVLVLIHGFCENKDLWKVFEKELLLNFRVIIPDLPGHGDSLVKTDEVSIEYLAKKVFDLLNFLEIKECVMVGHSLGGYVTLAFAERYPDMLKGFGLFHSTAFADPEEKKANRNRTIEFIEKNGMEPFADSFVAPLFYHKNRPNLKDQISMMQNTCRNTLKNAVIAITKAMRDRKDRIEVLKGSKVPVLFIIGKEDNAVPLNKSLEQCYLPQKHEVLILEETSHMGMFEKTKECERLLVKFVKDCYQ